MHEDPLDVSRNGCNGTLKSPPTISVPLWKAVNWYVTERKKATCFVFGAYMLAIVYVKLCRDPRIKMNLPFGSLRVSSTWKGQRHEIRIDTPLDFAVLLGAWYTKGKFLSVSFGIPSDRKCVSCRSAMWIFSFHNVYNRRDRFSGVFRPREFSEYNLIRSKGLPVLSVDGGFKVVIILYYRGSPMGGGGKTLGRIWAGWGEPKRYQKEL